MSSLPGGQGGGSGGDQPPLARLLCLQATTAWTGPCPGTEGQTSVSKESTDIEKSDGEEYVISDNYLGAQWSCIAPLPSVIECALVTINSQGGGQDRSVNAVSCLELPVLSVSYPLYVCCLIDTK